MRDILKIKQSLFVVVSFVMLLTMTGCRVTSSNVNHGDYLYSEKGKGVYKTIVLTFSPETTMHTVNRNTVSITGPHRDWYVDTVTTHGHTATVTTYLMENIGHYTLEVKGAMYSSPHGTGTIEPFKAVFRVTETPVVKSPYTGKFWTANSIKDKYGNPPGWTDAFNACPAGFRVPSKLDVKREMVTIPAFAQQNINPQDIEKMKSHFLHMDNGSLLTSTQTRRDSGWREPHYAILKFTKYSVQAFDLNDKTKAIWRHERAFADRYVELGRQTSDIRCIQNHVYPN